MVPAGYSSDLFGLDSSVISLAVGLRHVGTKVASMAALLSCRSKAIAKLLEDHAHWLRTPTPVEIGFGARYLGLALLALSLGSSTLTFDWIIAHRPEINFVGEFAGAVLYPSDVLLFFGLMFWMMGWYFSPSLTLRYGPWYVLIPVLTLAILTTLSILWASYGVQTGFIALRRILLVALYIVMVSESHRALVLNVLVLLVFGLLHAAVALVQVAEGSPVGLAQLGELGHLVTSRAIGLGFNPNPVGMFLSMVSILAYGWFLQRSGSWRLGILILLPFFLTFWGLVATASRTSFAAWLLGILIVSLLAWIGEENRRETLKRIVVALVSLFMLSAVFSIVVSYLPSNSEAQSDTPPIDIQKVLTRLTPEQFSSGLKGRVADWELSFPIIRENPLWGVGAGNYPLKIKEQLAPDTFGGRFVPVHNVLILVLVELGLLGAIAWASIMVSPLVWAISRRKTQRFESDSLLWLGPLVVLLFVSLMEFEPWATQAGRVLMFGILGLWAGSIAEHYSPST